ncbi:MAG: hypothetical protein JOZ81_33070 [Chloroflexi bacterium]|nr:hypothetical protein [Chloroflexota bacterium]
MHLTQSAIGQSTLAELYRSDLAYGIGLVVIWELLVTLVALWMVPVLLAAASAAGPLPVDAAVIGAEA